MELGEGDREFQTLLDGCFQIADLDVEGHHRLPLVQPRRTTLEGRPSTQAAIPKFQKKSRLG